VEASSCRPFDKHLARSIIRSRLSSSHYRATSLRKGDFRKRRWTPINKFGYWKSRWSSANDFELAQLAPFAFTTRNFDLRETKYLRWRSLRCPSRCPKQRIGELAEDDIVDLVYCTRVIAKSGSISPGRLTSRLFIATSGTILRASVHVHVREC